MAYIEKKKSRIESSLVKFELKILFFSNSLNIYLIIG